MKIIGSRIRIRSLSAELWQSLCQHIFTWFFSLYRTMRFHDKAKKKSSSKKIKWITPLPAVPSGWGLFATFFSTYFWCDINLRGELDVPRVQTFCANIIPPQPSPLSLSLQKQLHLSHREWIEFVCQHLLMAKKVAKKVGERDDCLSTNQNCSRYIARS